MTAFKPTHTTPQLVLGLLIILLGVLFTLDRLDFMDARDLLRFWPILLVIYGASRLLQPAGSQGRVWGMILVLAGGAMFIDRLDLLDFRLTSLWPLLLVAGGAALVLRAARRTGVASGVPADPRAGEPVLSAMALLGGVERTVSSADFRGGELTAVMGGCDVDLRQARIGTDPAVIDVFTLMGGVDIKVPVTWNVEVRGFPLLGGMDDKTAHPNDPQAPRLIVKGTAIMGGVEVTNG
jgi:hypothetical protein